MKKQSLTDWDKFKSIYDSDAPIPYDPEDAPYDPNDAEAVKAYWQSAKVTYRGDRGRQKAPIKTSVSIRLATETVEYFKSSGKGWQTRMDSALAEWVQQNSTFHKI